MNSKERVLASINRQPIDRTPLDCWLYQRQFVDNLEAEYGPREKFLDEFGIDISWAGPRTQTSLGGNSKSRNWPG